MTKFRLRGFLDFFFSQIALVDLKGFCHKVGDYRSEMEFEPTIEASVRAFLVRNPKKWVTLRCTKVSLVSIGNVPMIWGRLGH